MKLYMCSIFKLTFYIILVLSEALHSVAFKGGLERASNCPDNMLGRHSPEDVSNI